MGLFGPPNIEKMKAKCDIDGLIKALDYQKDPGVRRAAAEALGDLKEARSVGLLIVALKDENNSVRCNAANALGKIGDVGAVKALLQRSRIITVRYAILWP